jgi:hypothetical protein
VCKGLTQSHRTQSYVKFEHQNSTSLFEIERGVLVMVLKPASHEDHESDLTWYEILVEKKIALFKQSQEIMQER